MMRGTPAGRRSLGALATENCASANPLPNQQRTEMYEIYILKVEFPS
jgi:hypothetical protein